MRSGLLGVLVVLLVAGCKREERGRDTEPSPVPTAALQAAPFVDAGVARPAPPTLTADEQVDAQRKELIHATVRAHEREFVNCFELVLLTHPKLEKARYELDFSIVGGKVAWGAFPTGEPRELSECVTKIANRLVFPPEVEGVEVHYPLNFHAEP